MHLLNNFHVFFAKTCGADNVGFIKTGHLPQACADQSTLNTAFNVAFVIIGGLAFLYLVIAGMRYIVAAGNAEAVQKAKRQISQAIIGLIIVALSFAIVNYVIGWL